MEKTLKEVQERNELAVKNRLACIESWRGCELTMEEREKFFRLKDEWSAKSYERQRAIQLNEQAKDEFQQYEQYLRTPKM